MSDVSALERYRPIVDDWGAFCEALVRPLPRCIWTNTLRASPEELAGRLEEQGIPYEHLPWLPYAFKISDQVPVGNLFGFVAGLFHVQEEVSLLSVPLLDPQPGERILDLCAAPGNKTAQMAAHMGNTGTIIANDRNEGRQRALVATLNRIGVANTSTTVYDGTSFPGENGLFDRVLADVPCTCEGTSRKNPRALQTHGERQINVQEALLRRAIELCKPGGRVVYSTCTYAPEENEVVVNRMLQEFGDDHIALRPARLDGLVTSPGVTSWDGQSYDPSLAHALRVWPHQNDTGGFFAAVLEKRA